MNVRSMQARAWLHHALIVSGLSVAEFGNRYVTSGRERSGLVYKWINGTVVPGRRSVQRVESELPGTAWVFEHPLWELLAREPVPLRRIDVLLTMMTRGIGESRHWFFRGDEAAIKSGRPIPLAYVDFPDVLARRGDHWGLTGCLLLMRRAEARFEEREHFLAIVWAYRAAAGAFREPWLYQLMEEILDALDYHRGRYLYCSQLFAVNRGIIRDQATGSSYQPWREFRARDPHTNRFLDIADPIEARALMPLKFLGVLPD